MSTPDTMRQTLEQLMESTQGGNVTIRIEGTNNTQAKRPKSREGKKMIAGHFAPEVTWQLRKLALDQQTTVQSLLEEALNDLFEKNHLPRLS